MGTLKVKPGVSFDHIDPAGFRILGALDRVTRELPYDLTITCGTEGHSSHDPHAMGRGYDVRTHGLTADEKSYVLREVMLDLQEGPYDVPQQLERPALENLATRRFFGQIESPGDAHEHIHLQLRRRALFP